jgi:hypothetical protein
MPTPPRNPKKAPAKKAPAKKAPAKKAPAKKAPAKKAPAKKAPAKSAKTRASTSQKRGTKMLPWGAANSKAIAKKFYGGSFPAVNGRAHTYPDPNDEVAWMKLVRATVAHDKRRVLAASQGRYVQPCQDKRVAYLLFHASPVEIKRRGLRNLHRKQHGLAKGDKRHVHHRDPRTMSFAKTVVVDACAHQREHGKQCAEEKRRANING